MGRGGAGAMDTGPGREASSRFARASRDLLLGPRGISKMSHLWMPLAVSLTSDGGAETDLNAGPGAVLFLVAAVLCETQFSILVNDLSDREDDRAAGKRRWIAELPHAAGAVLVLLALAAGSGALVIGGAPPPALAAYAASALLGAAYSLKPLRFKERGVAGPLVYALSAAAVYVAVPWAWLGGASGLMIAVLAAVAADKWVQLHFHQVIDYAADLQRKVPTYAVRAGLARARATLRTASSLTCLVLALLVGAVVREAGPASRRGLALLTLAAAVLAASWVYARRVRARAGGSAASSTPAGVLPWPYLGLAYLAFHILPPALLAFAAAEVRWLWVPAALSALSLAAVSRQTLHYRHT